MKKKNILIRHVILLVLIATFVACASTRKHESPGQYLDDTVITSKVKLSLQMMIFSSPSRSVSKLIRAPFS
jgi:hypothetical protein